MLFNPFAIFCPFGQNIAKGYDFAFLHENIPVP
jgi:hypothetical protein